MLLAERHPEAKLAPEPGHPERADYLEWMVYLANVVQPAFRQWFYADEHVPDSAEAIATAGRIRIEASWDRIDAHLAAHGPYMLGEACSVVDLYLVMLMRWSRNMPRPATDWPQLAALAAKVKQRPSWTALYEQEKLTEWA
jgi:glutathione S-transferase